MSFLSDIQLRPVTPGSIPGCETLGLALGQGQSPLEVVALRSVTQPAVTAIRTAWKDRHGGRPAPVLLVAVYGNRAAVCGPSGDNPPVLTEVELGQAERLCRTALEEPDRHSALRFLRTALEAIDSPMAGLRNEGLLSTHEIGVWLRERSDLVETGTKSQKAISKRGQQLVMSLGFETSPLPGPASILVSKSNKLALAVFLDRNESPDGASERFSNLSPVTYALTKADQENLRYVIITNGPAIRIYPTDPGIGVGRRGRTETFLELHLDLLREDRIPLLWYLFSADALDADGSFEHLLDDSKSYATSLGERLRERVYQNAIPQLAKALVQAQALKLPTQQDLDSTYHMALTVLFRILFIAYGEDKDLLPYRTNDLYRARSFKQKATDLLKIREDATEFDAHSYSHWDDAVRLFEAVNRGSRELGVPLYSGGLFSEDPEVSPTGATLSNLRLSNSDFGPVLTHILVDESEEGVDPVDFRSLGVREFGTIYEGLLESQLSIAETDLTVDSKGAYKPATRENPEVRSGEVYIHNKSGARKATGSYFTKAFAVDHLLDHSLEPALNEHVARLEALDEVEAGKSFFDFRVADIAMGSGHFLVTAVDRIERRLQQYLSDRPLPVIIDELARLRASATEALGSLAEGTDIEDTTLLRRQIARRCIYGVDLNPVAVELARVSLWIHTFVPGLPLSMLDHHLVEGNSLVGIGTLAEAQELVYEAAGGPLFNVFVENLISSAAQSMAKVGDLADADAAEIQAARGVLGEARVGIAPLRAMFDILTGSRLDADIAKEVSNNLFGWLDKPEIIGASNLHRSVIDVMAGIQPFHFPVAFPDVFARTRAGFDVILGNPPWEKVMGKEDSFWARHFPGFSGRPQWAQEEMRTQFYRERRDLVELLKEEQLKNDLLRSMLLTGPYPAIGASHPDLYKAFCWRFWDLAAPSVGRIGVVLPRVVWNLMGSEKFRKMILQQGEVVDLTFLVNNREWIFESVHPQYTIALANLVKRPPNERSVVAIRGPFQSMMAFNEGVKEPPANLTSEEILGWTDTAAIPLLTTNGARECGQIMSLMNVSPRLGDNVPGEWRMRLLQGDMNSTSDKSLMTFAAQAPPGYWPIYKGETFDIWNVDKGPTSYYAWGSPATLTDYLQQKRVRSYRNIASAFSEFDEAWVQNLSTLPSMVPRLAYRAVSRSTDSRTIRAALVPANIFLVHSAPFLIWPHGDEADQAFLLGCLCSLVLDWYARRFIESNVQFIQLNSFPIPRPKRQHPLWRLAISLSGRLAAPDERFADWAKAVGVKHGPLEADEKEDMIHELDAAVAHLYGLSESQLRHIFETFHVGWNYEDRLVSTLDHYHRLESKL